MTVRKCNAHEPSSWLTERVSLATARHAVSSCPSLHEGLSVDARLRASCRLGSTQERRAAPGTKSRPEAERGTVRRVADTQGFARWGPALQSPSPSFTIYSFPGCRTRTARLVHSPVRAIGSYRGRRLSGKHPSRPSTRSLTLTPSQLALHSHSHSHPRLRKRALRNPPHICPTHHPSPKLFTSAFLRATPPQSPSAHHAVAAPIWRTLYMTSRRWPSTLKVTLSYLPHQNPPVLTARPGRGRSPSPDPSEASMYSPTTQCFAPRGPSTLQSRIRDRLPQPLRIHAGHRGSVARIHMACSVRPLDHRLPRHTR
jgi:hypothetical protein